MNIELHIDRLILEGIPLDTAGKLTLQAAVENELTRLLGEGGLAPELQTGAALASIHAGNIQIHSQNRPAHLGGQIARAVYSGIGEKMSEAALAQDFKRIHGDQDFAGRQWQHAIVTPVKEMLPATDPLPGAQSDFSQVRVQTDAPAAGATRPAPSVTRPSPQPEPQQTTEGVVLAYLADLEQRKKKVVSIGKSGSGQIGLFGDQNTGKISGFQITQNFKLELAKDARSTDYAIIQWIKGEMYEARPQGKVYWPANTGGALFGRTAKEPWSFNDWIIDSPDADPRFGSDRGVSVKVPVTNFSDSPGIIMQKGDLPAGLHWNVEARMGVYPWGSRVPTTIKEWESMRPEPFKETTWGWDIAVPADQESLDVNFK